MGDEIVHERSTEIGGGYNISNNSIKWENQLINLLGSTTS